MTDELDFGYADRLRRARHSLIVAANDCLHEVGRDAVESAGKFRTQDITDWLDARAGRRLPMEFVWALGMVTHKATLRDELMRAVVRPVHLDIAPMRPLTEAEKRARLEYEVAKRFGLAGAELVESLR